MVMSMHNVKEKKGKLLAVAEIILTLLLYDCRLTKSLQYTHVFDINKGRL